MESLPGIASYGVAEEVDGGCSGWRIWGRCHLREEVKRGGNQDGAFW